MGAQLSRRSMMAYESRLFRAIHKGDMDTIQHLVTKKIDLNKIENGHSALSLAIFCKNTAAVKLLLAAGCNINIHGNDIHLPPMFGAIVCQMPEYVQLLIQKGCDINMLHQGVSPLQFATEDYIGQGPTVEIIDMLVNAGANCNTVNSKGDTVLHLCAQNNKYEILKYLILKGKCGLDIQNEEKESALHVAIKCRNEDAASMLIDHGAEINAWDRDSMAPLLLAASEGCLKVVRSLVTRKDLDIDKLDDQGSAAIHHAAMKKHSQIVDVLLENGADMDKQNSSGMTAAAIAARQGDLITLKILLKNNAHYNLSDKKGRSPLYLASYYGHHDIVETLLQCRDVRVNQRDHCNKSPVYVAACHGHLPVVHMLIRAHADLNTVDKFGKSPLYMSVLHGHISITQCLIQAGANVDQYDCDGQGPLHVAVMFPKLDMPMLTLLLDSSADPINLDSFVSWMLEKAIVRRNDLGDLATWYQRLRTNAKPLKHLCRCVVREQLPDQKNAARLKEAVGQLPLPVVLKEYLCVKLL